MRWTISAREAHHNFARILREVESGSQFLVTRKGIPIARIVAAPRGERKLTPEQEAAHARSMARLRRGWDLGGEKFDRDFALGRASASHWIRTSWYTGRIVAPGNFTTAPSKLSIVPYIATAC